MSLIIETEAFHVENNLIKVIVPESAKSGTISLTVYSQKTSRKDTFTVVTGRFKKMKSIPVGRDLPRYIGYYAVGFSLNNKGYLANGIYNSFFVWEYNPVDNTWTRKLNFRENQEATHRFLL